MPKDKPEELASSGSSEQPVLPPPPVQPRYTHVRRLKPHTNATKKPHKRPKHQADDLTNLKWKSCLNQNASFNDANDRECVEYLSDLSNVKSIKPMAAILILARTIKFAATYKAPHLRTIMKTPQNNFVFEPYSEYVAYHIDRMLGLYRVPTTAWVELPIRTLREALKNADEKFDEWVETDVINQSEVQKKSIKMNEKLGEETIPVSIQVWMYGVTPLQNSEWEVEGEYVHWYDPLYPVPNFEGNKKNLLPQLSDTIVYDYILGNSDRKPSKNHYTVGGCVKQCHEVPDQPIYKGPTTLLHLDQGSSFYGREAPSNNPIVKQGHNFCRFRRRTIERLRGLTKKNGENSMLSQLLAKLPHNVWDMLDKPYVDYAQRRLDNLVEHVESCVQRRGEAAVLYW